MLRERFGVSQRRACRVVGQHRSTQRLDPPGPDEEEQRLRAWLRAFSTERPRWGWRRAAKQARREGWAVNDKRIQRLWRQEGLKVPYRKRKKPHRGIGTAIGAMCPIVPNALWAMDFQFDTTADGRMLKLFNLVDEYTRECPVIVVADPSTPTRSWPPWTDSPSREAFRPTYASTTAPSSSLPPWLTGAGSTASHRLHRPWFPVAERLDRVVQRPSARRVPQRLAVRQPA